MNTTRWILSSLITVIIILLIASIPVWKNTVAGKKTEKKELKSMTIVKYIPHEKIPLESPVTEKTDVPDEKIKTTRENKKAIPEKPTETDELEIKEEHQEEENQEEQDSEISDEQIPTDEKSSAEEKKGFTEEQKKKRDSYKSQVLQKIDSKKKYPKQSRANNQTGKIRMHISILPDGNLESIEIIGPCEHELLNEAALNAVKKAAPFKKMDSAEKLEFNFIMDFALN